LAALFAERGSPAIGLFTVRTDRFEPPAARVTKSRIRRILALTLRANHVKRLMLDTQAQEAKQPAPLAPPTPTLPEAVDLLERNMIGQTLLPFFACEELVTNDWRISMLVALGP
jgi:hypothetical protein